MVALRAPTPLKKRCLVVLQTTKIIYRLALTDAPSTKCVTINTPRQFVPVAPPTSGGRSVPAGSPSLRGRAPRSVALLPLCPSPLRIPRCPSLRSPPPLAVPPSLRSSPRAVLRHCVRNTPRGSLMARPFGAVLYFVRSRSVVVC